MILAELSLNLPMLSAVFLLIAGVLVGYAIAFPMRGTSDTVVGELRALREQNQDLESALTQQRDAYARLERRDRDRNTEWLELQASARRMEAALQKQMESDPGDQLGALQQAVEEARIEAAREREKRHGVEQRCATQEQTLDELRVATENYRDLQAKYNALREELVQKQELLQRAEAQKQTVEATLVERDQALRSMSQGTADSATAKMEMSQRIQTLEAALARQDQRLATLDEEKRHALDQLEVERAQRLSIEELLESRERALADLIEEAGLLEERDLEMAELTQRLRRNETELKEKDVQIEQVLAEVAQLKSQHQVLNEELASHQRAFATIERHRNQLRAERDELAIQLKSGEEQAVRLQGRIDHLSDLESQTTGYANQLRQNQQDLQRLCSQLREATLEKDTAQAQVATTQSALDEIEQRLNETSAQNEEVRRHREELWQSLRAEEQRRLEAARALEAQTRRVTSLSDQVNQLDPLRAEVAALRRHLVARDQQLEALRGQANEVEQLKVETAELREFLDNAQRAETDASQALREIQGVQDQQQRLLTQYRNERDRALAELRTLTVEVSRRSSNEAPLAGCENHPVLGQLYREPPQQADDLKLISGIAEVLESRLHELGIYTFAQIMSWQPQQVEEFSRLLSFPDRIARENWVAQARKLYQERSRAA